MLTEQERERHWNDRKYVEQCRGELYQQYPEQWIAVLDKTVVAYADDYRVLFKKVDELGYRRDAVFVKHLVAREPRFVILRI